MSNDDIKTREATVIPVARNDQGDLRGVMIEKDGSVKLTEFRKLKDGQPLMGDHTRLSPIENTPYLAAEITELPPVAGVPKPEPEARGSAQVGYSAAYAEGWERIFGKKDVGEA